MPAHTTIFPICTPWIACWAFLYAHQEMELQEAAELSENICADFFAKLPEVQQKLLKDVQAGFDGDPAAKSKEEIISSYPGVFAI